MRRLRVLHTVGNLELGGGQKLVVLVAGALDPARYDVAVLSFGPPGPYDDQLRARGIEVINLGLVRPLGKNDLRRLVGAARTLVRQVVRGRWDVVHTHMFLSSVVVTPLARLGRARAFGTVHRVYYGRRQAIIERIIAPLQERIVVDSYAVREILRSHTHIPERKYVVIYNGIDVHEFDGLPSAFDARAAVGVDRSDLVVGEVAHLAPHKGQRHLIEAIARLAPEHAALRLLLVGDGPDRVQLEALVASRGLHDRVTFAGARGDLKNVLVAMDVLALPSTFEGFGIVQAEAMYLGKPVVATSHGGSTEVVVDGTTGFLVPFGDVAALADRLSRLVGDAALREQFGRAGRDRALEHFTASTMAEGYESLYQDHPATSKQEPEL